MASCFFHTANYILLDYINVKVFANTYISVQTTMYSHRKTFTFSQTLIFRSGYIHEVHKFCTKKIKTKPNFPYCFYFHFQRSTEEWITISTVNSLNRHLYKINTSIRWTPSVGPNPVIFKLFYCNQTSYTKTDTSLRRTVEADPDSVCFREGWLYNRAYM